MGAEVLNLNIRTSINIGTKQNICTLNAPPSASPKPLAAATTFFCTKVYLPDRLGLPSPTILPLGKVCVNTEANVSWEIERARERNSPIFNRRVISVLFLCQREGKTAKTLYSYIFFTLTTTPHTSFSLKVFSSNLKDL